MLFDKLNRKNTFSDPDKANKVLAVIVEKLPEGIAELFIEQMGAALADSPDADSGLVNFDRWASALNYSPAHLQFCLSHNVLLNLMTKVFASSDFLTDILVQFPESYELLADPAIREMPLSSASAHAQLSNLIEPCNNFLLKLDRLRHFKHREILRIGAMDVSNQWNLPAVALALSNFADACVQTAYEICLEELKTKRGMSGEPGFAVIAMGKLGGQELNYSSDIDLIFIHSDRINMQGKDDPTEFNIKLAEAIVNALSGRMSKGIVFRVDLRLRPEGRFGILSRSLAGCKQYYETWAEPWEFQALIKARCIAGDISVGDEFLTMVKPLIYRRYVLASTIDAIRANKQRSEIQVQTNGEWETDIKNGRGGIRDIEFVVQLLQIVRGGRQPSLQTGNTLTALQKLYAAGLIELEEAELLSSGYCFLRTVEHRMMIMREQQIHTLPNDAEELEKLARRMNFASTDDFMNELNRVRDAVRSAFEKLFFGKMFRKEIEERSSEWRVLLDNPDNKRLWMEALEKAGFDDPNQIAELLRIPLAGTHAGESTPETKTNFLLIAPELLKQAQLSPNPDALITKIENLASATPSRAQLYRSFYDSPEVLRRLGELGVYAPLIFDRIVQRQELLDMLFSDEIIKAGCKSFEEHCDDIDSRLKPMKTSKAQMKAFVNYSIREVIRIAARDVWGETEPDDTAIDLTNLAYAQLKAVMNITAQSNNLQSIAENIAIIALGKMGGGELGYASDWDIFFLRDSSSATMEQADEFIESFLSTSAALNAEGLQIAPDLRLRPEGRFGTLSRTIETLDDYYLNQAQRWEKQSLIKAKALFGKPSLIEDFNQLRIKHAFGAPLDEQGIQEVRTMKERLEKERLKADEALTDVKLGHGGMNDIEFTAQLLQMMHGHQSKKIQSRNTLRTLNALFSLKYICRDDYLALRDNYRRLYALRNKLYLIIGLPTDLIPDNPKRLKVLSRAMGFNDVQAFLASHKENIREVRRIFEKLFWGKDK